MALAATGSVDIAEQVSSATGHEMKLAGINWAYRYVVLVLQQQEI
jgi:beta-N-acetylhexosaminidase